LNQLQSFLDIPQTLFPILLALVTASDVVFDYCGKLERLDPVQLAANVSIGFSEII